MNLQEAYLRSAARQRSYVISRHAFQRMGERGITEEDIEKCVLKGQILEKQDHGGDVKLLVHGIDGEGEVFYVVVALACPCPVIVTVCRFRQDAWEDLGSRTKRRV
ncbi:MAG: DUF4258 domain-containing protein [Clostridia bacterium]